MATIDLLVGVDIAGATQKFKELREAAKSAVSGVSGDIDATDALFEALSSKVNKAKSDIKKAQSEISANKEWIKKLSAQSEEAEKAISAAPTNAAKKKAQEYLDDINGRIREEIGLLEQNRQKLKQYNEALNQSQLALKMAKTELKNQEKSYPSIRTQMTNVRNEMAALDLAGQKNSARYKELQNELGRLGTAYRKVQFEQKALSTGATQWAGIQSTLQGLMGGFAAYQGVLGLVADSSEDLVKIQTRLQSVMGIIMGMTQVSNTLHATSAARMTTLTKVTELWNAANLRVGKGLISMGVAANTARIAAIALNGALTLGIGAAIGIAIGWITKIVEKHKEAKKAAEEAAKKQREAFDSYANEVGQKAGGTIAKFKSLQEQYNKLGDSLSAKKKFIKENADAFKELGVKIGNVNDADNLFIKNADSFVASVDARARAAATMTVASEKYKEAFEKMLEAENVRDTQKELEESGYTKIVQSGGLNILDDKQRKELDEQLNAEKIRIQGKYTTVSPGGAVYSDYDKINEEYNEAREGIIKTFLDSVIEDLEKQKENSEKQGGEAAVKANDFTKEAREKMKSAGITTNEQDDDAQKRAKAETDAQKKLATELANLEFNVQQAQIDIMKDGTEKKLAQIKLDYKKREYAINEGEKKLMDALSKVKKSPEQIDAAQQMQSQFKGNVDHLSRPLIASAELVKKGWEDAGDGIATVFSSQYGILDASGKETEILVTPILPDGTVLSPKELEDYIFGTLQGAQDILKADDKKLVIATDVSTDGSAGDKYHQLQETYYNDAIQIAEKIQEQRDAANREAALSSERVYRYELQQMDNYLKSYGTYQEKKLAIAQEYDRKIAESTDQYEIKSLQQQKANDIRQVDVEALKAQIDWTTVFGEFGGMFKDVIKPVLEDVKAYIKTDDFKNLDPTDQNTIIQAIQQMEQSIGEGGKLDFKGLGEAVNRLQEEQEKLEQAEERQREALEKLKKATDEYEESLKEGSTTDLEQASQNLSTAQSEADEASREVKEQSKNVTAAQENVATSANGLSQSMKNVTDGLSKLASGSLSQAWSGLLQAGSTFEGAIGKVSEKLQNVPIIGWILSIIDIFKDGLSNVVGGLLDAIFNAVSGIISDILSGDLVVTILKSVRDGLKNVFDALTFGGISSLFDAINGSNAKEVQRTTERLTAANKSLEQSINALKDRIEKEKLGAVESASAYKEAIAKQKQVTKNTSGILAAQMSYHDAHHSNDYYISGDLTAEDWERISQQTGKSVKNTSDLWALSPEDLKKVSELTDIWTKIYSGGEYDKTEYIDQYLDQAYKIEELEDGLKEALTKVSFDSIYDSFIDTLMDMEASADDFAKDVSQLMMKAMISEMVTSKYKDRLKKWYDDFADAMNDGELTEQEIEQLQESNRQIAEDAIKERDAIAKVLGYTGDSANAQEASARGFQAMSQDTGEELNGRFTDIQGKVTDIRDYVLQITANGTMQLNEVINIRDIMIQISGNVADIRTNTNVLPDMSAKLDKIIRNTENI